MIVRMLTIIILMKLITKNDNNSGNDNDNDNCSDNDNEMIMMKIMIKMIIARTILSLNAHRIIPLFFQFFILLKK